MKNFKNYLFRCRNKSIRNLGRVASMIMAAAILYGCASEEVENISKMDHLAFEKQLVITDESGNNSITLKISAVDEAILAGYTVDNYELIINEAHAQVAAKGESTLDFEKSEPLPAPTEIKETMIAVKIAVADVDFEDAVDNYSLVSKPSPVEVEGLNFCFWNPRDPIYTHVLIENPTARGIFTWFDRDKKTCNNVEYNIAEYGSSTIIKRYQLRHPGDQATCFVRGYGIYVYYRYYSNAVVRYNSI